MTVVSALALTRVAGLPADALDIVSPATRELLAEIVAFSDRIRELAPRLIDLFYGLVPELDDDIPLRRSVLAAKRAANRLAAPPWDTETRQRLDTWVSPAESALIDAWDRIAASRRESSMKLEARLAADRVAAVARLNRTLEVPGFARSLALAAPDWILHGRPTADSARNLKTLYSYVCRAAVKTSPFSGLTTVGTAGTAGRGRARSRTSAAVPHLALHRLARDERTAGLLRYRRAPLRPGGRAEPAGILLHGEVMVAEGIIWRQDRVVEADHALRWIEALPERPALEEVLAAIGGDRPFARFRRLLDTGILHPVPPWEQGEDPLPALAGVLGPALVDQDSPISAADLLLAHELGARAHRDDVQGRVEAAARLQRITAGWSPHGDRGERGPSGLIYEDRQTELPVSGPFAAGAVEEDLRTLGALVRPYIFRSHVYDLLLERFRAEFGVGGVCRDPLGFLMRLSVERDADPPLEEALAADMMSRSTPGDRAWLPVGPTSAPPAAGVLFQIEAADQRDVEAGSYRLVVNHFSTGTGGLFTRFGALLGADFRRRLAEYVESCWAGVRCRELVLWSECNTVQAECGGLLPPLVLPGEVVARDGITLDDTLLVHDSGSDTLALCDRAGEPVGLAYLGLIPQHLLQSYPRLLAVLADPWINGSPHSDYTMTKLQELRRHCADDVVALPRVARGRLVTRRASWIVPVTGIPRPAPGEDDAGLAVRLAEFRSGHAIPEEVFVHQLGGPGFALTGDRKPMWVSLASPLSVGVLAKWLSPGTTHVRMVEALPERDRHPQRDAHGRRRVTEHAALLSWPKEAAL